MSDAQSRNNPASRPKICEARRLHAGAEKMDFAKMQFIENLPDERKDQATKFIN
jgi:hypothetical protein